MPTETQRFSSGEAELKWTMRSAEVHRPLTSICVGDENFLRGARARKKVFFLLDALRRAAGGCARFGMIGERIHACSSSHHKSAMRVHWRPFAAKVVRATCSNGLGSARLAPDFEVQAPPHGLIMVWTKVGFFECSDLQADLAHGDAAILER